MTEQQQVELGFWRSLVEQHGDNYRAFRVGEYEAKTKYFEPWWSDQKGVGCDIGCGCVSVFDDAQALLSQGKIAWAIDPLMDHYQDLVPMNGACYATVSAENMDTFVDGSFHWLTCINMLDHTPNPSKAVAEMYRVLKPGGRLYFEVHLDDALSPAHYGLWNEETVREVVEPVFTNCLMKKVVRVDEDNQSQVWAVYQK